jgi:glycosyltransferase involved in cell wall biosynthesis
MKFSIAMATYNGENYILEQLESFESQDYKPYELVICDDASTDTTLEIIREFSIKSSFKVRVYENEINLGYIKNFEKAISLCEGEWIALSDQDDKWYQNKLSTIKNKIDSDDSIKIIVHNYDIGDKQLVKQKTNNMERLISAGEKPVDVIAGCATVFSQSLLSLILPIPKSIMAHDVWLHKVIKYAKTNTKSVVEESLMVYRRHGNNASEAFESTNIKQTKLRKLMFYKVSNPLLTYEKTLLLLDLIFTRLFNHGLDTSFVKNDMNILADRIKILTSPVLVRQYLAFRFLCKGYYKNYNGVISFINDLFRARCKPNVVEIKNE